MKIRSLLESDLERLNDLHEKFFNDEFKFPDFKRFLGTMCVLDDNNDIVLAGGCKPIYEAILVTNKDKTVRERREALLYALRSMMLFCGVQGENHIHAFVQDNTFAEQLKKFGFKNINGEGLVFKF